MFRICTKCKLVDDQKSISVGRETVNTAMKKNYREKKREGSCSTDWMKTRRRYQHPWTVYTPSCSCHKKMHYWTIKTDSFPLFSYFEIRKILPSKVLSLLQCSHRTKVYCTQSILQKMTHCLQMVLLYIQSLLYVFVLFLSPCKNCSYLIYE